MPQATPPTRQTRGGLEAAAASNAQLCSLTKLPLCLLWRRVYGQHGAFYLNEEVSDKLKILDYESTFCEENDMVPFPKTYFAMQSGAYVRHWATTSEPCAPHAGLQRCPHATATCH